MENLEKINVEEIEEVIEPVTDVVDTVSKNSNGFLKNVLIGGTGAIAGILAWKFIVQPIGKKIRERIAARHENEEVEAVDVDYEEVENSEKE